MSCVGTYDICLYEGDDKTLLFRYKSSDDIPIDITGYSFFLECSEPTLSKTGSTRSAADGEFIFVYVPADTADLVTGFTRKSYNYDVKTIKDDATVETLMRGKLVVQREVK